MTQLVNSVNTDLNFGKTIEIDMANNLILAEREEHSREENHHHHKEAEAKAEGEKEAEAKAEGEKEGEAKAEGEKEGEAKAEGEKEGETEGEEVAAFIPTVDFGAEHLIYFGAGLLSLALLAVVIIWVKGYSGENE